MQQDTDSVYTLSLIYYAYSLYGMDVTYKRNVLDRLQAKAISQGQMRFVDYKLNSDKKVRIRRSTIIKSYKT